MHLSDVEFNSNRLPNFEISLGEAVNFTMCTRVNFPGKKTKRISRGNKEMPRSRLVDQTRELRPN